MSKECDGEWKTKEYYKDSSVLYVPHGNRITGLSNLKVEDMISKVVKRVVKMEDYLKEIRVDILGISQQVESYSSTKSSLSNSLFRHLPH